MMNQKKSNFVPLLSLGIVGALAVGMSFHYFYSLLKELITEKKSTGLIIDTTEIKESGPFHLSS